MADNKVRNPSPSERYQQEIIRFAHDSGFSPKISPEISKTSGCRQQNPQQRDRPLSSERLERTSVTQFLASKSCLTRLFLSLKGQHSHITRQQLAVEADPGYRSFLTTTPSTRPLADRARAVHSISSSPHQDLF